MATPGLQKFPLWNGHQVPPLHVNSVQVRLLPRHIAKPHLSSLANIQGRFCPLGKFYLNRPQKQTQDSPITSESSSLMCKDRQTLSKHKIPVWTSNLTWLTLHGWHEFPTTSAKNGTAKKRVFWSTEYETRRPLLTSFHHESCQECRPSLPSLWDIQKKIPIGNY